MMAAKIKKGESGAKKIFYFEDVADGFPLQKIKAMQKNAKIKQINVAGIEMATKKEVKIRKAQDEKRQNQIFKAIRATLGPRFMTTHVPKQTVAGSTFKH